MLRRARDDETPCVGVWPITGEACRNAPRPGTETCDAHDPGGDQRAPAPPEEQRCIGTNRESGERCRRHHPPGAAVCYKHGGNAPQVRAKAAQRTAVEKAKVMAATYGLPIEITPERAILEEVHRTAGHVAWLAQQIHAMTEGELVWGITRVKEGGDDRGVTEEAVPHAYLKLYQTERAHLAKVCADAIRVGIEARQVKLAEQQGAMVAQAIRAILDDLQLTRAQRAMVADVVPRHLRELALTN